MFYLILIESKHIVTKRNKSANIIMNSSFFLFVNGCEDGTHLIIIIIMERKFLAAALSVLQ